MKKWTNLLLVALLLIMSMALIQPVFASEKAAVDVNGHWAEKQISAWMDQGLIKGYADGSFKPNDSVTTKKETRGTVLVV